MSIKITINSVEEIISENTSLEDIIFIKNIDIEGIAIGVNDEVIPRIEWKSFILKKNDRILIITATRGG